MTPQEQQEHEIVGMLVDFFNAMKAWYDASPTARAAFPTEAEVLLQRIMIRSKSL